MRGNILLLVLLAVAACNDKDVAGPGYVTRAGNLQWRALVDTSDVAPQLIRISTIGRNLTNHAITIYVDNCEVTYRVHAAAQAADTVYDSKRYNCGSLPLREVTIARGDSIMLSSTIPKHLVLAPTSGITEYNFIAAARFYLSGDRSSEIRTSDLIAGRLQLSGQEPPLPSFRVRGGMETTTSSSVVGDTVRVAVRYRNVSDTAQVVIFGTAACRLTLSVLAYRDRAQRDYPYLYSTNPTFSAVEQPPCVDRSLRIAPGESTVREIVLSKSSFLRYPELYPAGTYYLSVYIPEPTTISARYQSAGEFTLP